MCTSAVDNVVHIAVLSARIAGPISFGAVCPIKQHSQDAAHFRATRQLYSLPRVCLQHPVMFGRLAQALREQIGACSDAWQGILVDRSGVPQKFCRC